MELRLPAYADMEAAGALGALDIRSGADRCVLLKEYPDIYQLWADGMCEEMERASAQKNEVMMAQEEGGYLYERGVL